MLVDKREKIEQIAAKEIEKLEKKIAAQSEKARCNKVAVICHTIVSTVIAIAYIMEFIKGARTLPYVLIVAALALATPVAEIVLYRKNSESNNIKHILSYGFAVLYIFVMLTTNNTLTFTYVIPMIIAISVYNDYKYTIPIDIGVIVVNIIQGFIFLANGTYTMDNYAGLEIQVLVVIIISVMSMYTSNILEINSKVKLLQIQKQNKKTEEMLDNIMDISNKMVTNVDTVDGKISDLSQAIAATREAMSEVNTGSNDTALAVQRQLEMTEEIQRKVETVENSSNDIAQSVRATKDAIDAGNNNISFLLSKVSESVESGKQVTAELKELDAYMSKMNSIVDIITEITTQTSLLALNASIEAARAGEAGKGFAVVASEISKMADETQDATVKITDLISDVSEAIARVVEVTGNVVEMIESQNEVTEKTALSFEKIGSNADTILDNSSKLENIVKELADSNKEIIDSISTVSAISEEVAAHANDTFNISEQNAETVEHVVAVSGELKGLAKQLAQG